jgi:hypothetical protein
MPSPTSAAKVLDAEFLPIRCRLIDLAAALDRIGRADGAPTDDPRMAQIRRGLEILAGDAPGRAQRVQLEFSLPYDQKSP